MHNLFERLPDELLLEIFIYELLVPYRKIQLGQKEVTYSQGVTIIDGKSEHPYPSALFKVDKRTSRLARTCTFSANRFILGGKPESVVAWLTSQPRELINMIRRLDLLILPTQFYDIEGLDGFSQVLAVLNNYFELESLCLSIDASRLCQELDQTVRSHHCLKPTYHKLLQIFQDNQDICKVKDFWVYYPQWKSEEAKLEKSVKGSNYDSIARGKESFKRRDYRLIHGWEYGVYYAHRDWEFTSDWEEYSQGWCTTDGVFMDAAEELRRDLLPERYGDAEGQNKP